MKKLESALVLRMVFGRLVECSINDECNVAGSSKQLTFFFVCLAGWLVLWAQKAGMQRIWEFYRHFIIINLDIF